MPNEIEIVATPRFERRRFHNDDGDVVILTASLDDTALDEAVCLKGPADDEGPVCGMPYRFWGRWSKYLNKRTGVEESQFSYSSYVRSGTPKGRDAVIAYLSCCEGIGKVFASRIYTALGEDSIRVCREEPEKAMGEVDGLGRNYAPAGIPLGRHLAAWLAYNADQEETMAELAGLLKGRGFPRETPKLAVKEWGNRAPVLIRKNPYLLMRFDRIGFRRTDAMYLDLGLPPHRLKRQALCVQHAIDAGRGGDTWHYVEVANQAVRAMIGATKARPEEAIRLAVRGKLLAAKYTRGVNGPPDDWGDTFWLAAHRKARSERLIVENLERLDQAGFRNDPWPVPHDDSLTDHQGWNLATATIRPVGVLAGCPGTGKTYTAAALVKAVIERAGVEAVALGAPTGKAAVRLTESMSRAGVGVAARTIHSLLEADGKGFGRGPGKHQQMLDQLYYLIDESSMIDADLMAALLAAIPTGACVLFIGDTNQLLPVGHGAPLRDLIDASVPTGELTEIQRNSGGIVEACAAIRQGKAFGLGDNLTRLGGELAAEDVVGHCATLYGFDPIWQVQVVTAVNEKSDLSRRELNRRLQVALNPSDRRIGPFRLGDKIVCTANGWFKPLRESGPGVVENHDGRVRVANGELGRVEAIDGRRMEVSLSSPSRYIRVPVGPQRGDHDIDEEGGDTGCNFDLAYALSVHKAQGSEFPCVVVTLDPSGGAAQVMDRAWVYTAISRAKDRCVLWGDLSTAHRACKRDRINQRKTFLREGIEASRFECLQMEATASD